MTTISIDDAKDKLAELIHSLRHDGEVMITEHGQPVARLVPAAATNHKRQLGFMQGTVLHMADDFDAPLEDFQEYM
jgi:prevent-host-death family protein